MLRRADNVTLDHRPNFFTGRGPIEVTVGRKFYRLGKFSRAEFEDREWAQMTRPAAIMTVDGRRYWQFDNKFYWENDGLTSGEVYALLVTREQRNRQRIDRAQATVAMGSQSRRSASRQAIPDDQKQYIWARDEGRCRNCGSTSELQFDHIIPLAMGGSNDDANLQILCGPCNRSKSAGLTTRR